MESANIDIEKFGDFEVYNEYSDTVKISSLWKDSTAVLVFIRHFG